MSNGNARWQWILGIAAVATLGAVVWTHDSPNSPPRSVPAEAVASSAPDKPKDRVALSDTWAMMLMGFGLMGVSLRRRRRTQTLLQAA